MMFCIGPSWCPRSSWSNRKIWKKGMVSFHCTFWGHLKSSVILFSFILCYLEFLLLSHVLGIIRVVRVLMEEEECQENPGPRSGAHLIHLYFQISYLSSPLKFLYFKIEFIDMKERFTLKLQYRNKLEMWWWWWWWFYRGIEDLMDFQVCQVTRVTG